MIPIGRTERKRLAKKLSEKINQVLVEHDCNYTTLARSLHVNPSTFRGWWLAENCPKHRDLYNKIESELDTIIKNTSVQRVPDEPTTVSALDVQVGGTHYKDRGIQPIQYIEANHLEFLEGCVVKRVTRHDKPTGKGVQDIDKAIHELQLLKELRYA